MRRCVTVAACAVFGVGLTTGCAVQEPDRSSSDSSAEIVQPTPAPAEIVQRGQIRRAGMRVDVQLDHRCETGRVLCADKSTDSLRWVVDGKVVMSFDARFGARGSPTREGAFEVYAKDRDHVSSLYGTPMPFTMFFSGGEAVHFSRNFATRGYSGRAHGCINLRDYRRAARLFDRVRVGDRVIVYRSTSLAGENGQRPQAGLVSQPTTGATN